MPRHLRMDDADFARQQPPWLRDALARTAFGDRPLPLFLLDDDDGSWDTPAAFFFTMPPNWTLFKHAHSARRFEVIVKGSLTLPDGRVLGPGDVMLAEAGEMYGPHTAGPDGCTTLECCGTIDGIFELTIDGPDGPVAYDVRDGWPPPADILDPSHAMGTETTSN